MILLIGTEASHERQRNVSCAILIDRWFFGLKLLEVCDSLIKRTLTDHLGGSPEHNTSAFRS